MWKFISVGGDRYYLTTETDGTVRYLSIGNGDMGLLEMPDATCVINVMPGTGTYSGKYRFTCEGRSINLHSGKAANGFCVYSDAGPNEWMYLVEESSLQDDDFVSWSASKVSVSDTVNVTNGSQVIIYTRIWNDAEKEYEFYAIDHDGTLVRCFESGDTIRWVGTKVNTLLWDFTEYYYEGTSNPNYYYELQNHYSKKYIAPQILNGQILSGRPIGINLNGRRYGAHYTSILAWDDPYYDYAALQAAGYELKAVPMAQAQDFYFAVMNPVTDRLTTVETIDNDEFGIRMKMQNYDYQGYKIGNGYRQIDQVNVLGPDMSRPGLLSTLLDPSTGYPMTESGVTQRESVSLGTLYSMAQDANHLFIKSIYEESGYFEYNCTQNFAHLNENGDFTVYDQIGTIETGNVSLRHGQFMPYNNLQPGLYSQRYVNETNELDQDLSTDDPRYGEQMYTIPFNESSQSPDNADYFFGMQLEADFMQSEGGLDAWGHDLIFEFAGDDDMWLYVDGELILDLGGVHAAQVGTINFRTGEINQNGKKTTLRAVIEANYKKRNPQATNLEVTTYLNTIFGGSGTVFPDYTSHAMKMFYMERGAGASNLHMRFNLSPVKAGQLQLSKKISGTEKQDYVSAEFPYQIFYVDEHYNYVQLDDSSRVLLAGTNEPVKYREEADGYAHVFFLKPGQTATISLPDDYTEYYVRECRVNTNIYDRVEANGTELTGTEGRVSGTMDYTIAGEQVSQRKKVVFDNHVDPASLRTLSVTKRLYDETGRELSAEEDSTLFRFRIRLGENLDYYRLGSYHVKNPAGEYCVYDSTGNRFVSTGITDITKISESQITKATFTTSPSGAVDKIPAGYTVEIRDLMVGTNFRVEETPSDIPAGYGLIEYTRQNGSYIVEEGDLINAGVIRDNADPAIEVHNRRGFGLTAQKVWSDQDFMDSHDDLYFAVYAAGQMVDGTLRRMKTSAAEGTAVPESSLYYFFEALEEGCTFDDYSVREMNVTAPEVDENGYVTAFESAQPIDEDGMLTNGGVPSGSGQHEDGFAYRVHYETGDVTGASENVKSG